jgi:hypothetical protein
VFIGLAVSFQYVVVVLVVVSVVVVLWENYV